MARDLKGIKSSKPKKDAGEANYAAPFGPTKESDIGELVEKYRDKSEAELMSELMRITKAQRQEGIFDASSLSSAAEAIMPMLNAKQTEKLSEILSKL